MKVSSWLGLSMMAALPSFAQSSSDSLVFDIVVRDFQSTFADAEQYNVDNPASGCTTQPSSGSIGLPTLGMVKDSLLLADPTDLTSGKPQMTDGRCASTNLNKWFVTDPSVNKEVKLPLVLRRVGTSSLFSIAETYQSKSGMGYRTTGFFPLDTIDPDGTQGRTYGRQNYINWCTANASTPRTTCMARSTSYARTGVMVDPSTGSTVPITKANITSTDSVDASGVLWSKVHNYNFSVEGSAIIQYNGGEIFSFSGDDDTWIFIDDKLAVDLGGTHMPASASIKMDSMAYMNGWQTGSYHKLKFFNVERQTDGSNFTMSASFKQPPSIYTALTADAAKACGAGQSKYLTIYLSSQILQSDYDAINSGKVSNPFLLKLHYDGSIKPFTPSAITYVPYDGQTTLNERALGFKYQLAYTGVAPVSAGDSIAVNDSAVVNGVLRSLENQTGKATNVKVFAPFASDQCAKLASLPSTNQAMDFPVLPNLSSVQSQLASNSNKSQGAEILFTTGSLSDSLNYKTFTAGAPASNQTVLSGNGSTSNPNNCSITDSSGSLISPCILVPDAIEAYGPFELKVSLYDVNGQFVRDYVTSVDSATARAIQAKTGVVGDVYNNASFAGFVSIYPMDMNGRLLGSGVYFLKVDQLLLPFQTNIPGGVSPETGSRTSSFYKVPYVRPKIK